MYLSSLDMTAARDDAEVVADQELRAYAAAPMTLEQRLWVLCDQNCSYRLERNRPIIENSLPRIAKDRVQDLLWKHVVELVMGETQVTLIA